MHLRLGLFFWCTLLAACSSVTIGNDASDATADSTPPNTPLRDGGDSVVRDGKMPSDHAVDAPTPQDAARSEAAPRDGAFQQDAVTEQPPPANEAGEASVSPSQLPTEGLTLHLDASTLPLTDGDPVLAWADRSTRGYDATAISEPVFAAQGINGHPAVYFDGVDDAFTLPPAFHDFTAGVTLFIVTQPGTLTAGAKLLSLGNGPDFDNVALGRAGTTNGLQYFTVQSTGLAGFFESTTGLSPAAAAVLGAHQAGGVAGDGVAGTVTVDGVVVGTGMVYVPPVVERAANFVAKSHYPADGYYQGLIAEIALYTRLLPSADRTAIQAHFRAKYDL